MEDDYSSISVKTEKMAKPIKETPVLKGKHAKRFLEIIKTTSAKKVTDSDLKRMRASFNKLSNISTF